MIAVILIGIAVLISLCFTIPAAWRRRGQGLSGNQLKGIIGLGIFDAILHEINKRSK